MRNAVRDFSDLLDEAVGHQGRLLTEAFEAGRSVGRREATENLRAKLAGLLSEEPAAESANELAADGPREFFADDGVADLDVAGSEGPERRASPGSVKPAIAKLVAEEPGLTREEIQKRTGFKFNSVRGTLWTLEKENVVAQNDGRFYPAATKDEAVGTEPDQGAPTASVRDDLVDILGP